MIFPITILAQSCIPSQFVGKTFNIVQTQKDIPLLNVNAVKLNGSVTLQDCNAVLTNLDYYPPFLKTYLYGSNDPDPRNSNADGYKISLDEIQPAVSLNSTYELNGVDKLQDIKVIKFYSEDAKLVLGYVQLSEGADVTSHSKTLSSGIFVFMIKLLNLI